jgi:hypothetical protein
MNQILFGKLALGAVVSTLALALSGCGGSSSSSTPAATTSTLLAAPSAFIAFGNTANTVGITGGKGPFAVVSSNPTLLPVTASISGASFTFTPGNVAVATPVTLTVTDSAAATSAVTVTVTPATIAAPLITITPASASVCAPVNNAATSAATLCEGEAASASVTVRDSAGVAIANRSVRFEVLTVGVAMAPTATTPVFGRIATVDTNAQGVATVALRADVGGASEAAFIRATDTVSTHRVDTWVMVLKQTNAVSALSVVPTTGGLVGYYASECSRVRREYNVYGGTAPYSVSLPAGSLLVLANESAAAAPGAAVIVANSGGRFMVESAASTTCTSGSTALTITDATGATFAAAYAVTPGSAGRPTASVDLAISPPTLTLNADPLSSYCSTSSGSFTISGGTAPYVVSTSIPQISASLSGGTNVTVSFASNGKWKLLKAQSVTVFVLDAAGKVATASLVCG